MKLFVVLNTILHTNSTSIFSPSKKIDMKINIDFIELFETEEVN